jgi:hypothetical protein
VLGSVKQIDKTQSDDNKIFNSRTFEVSMLGTIRQHCDVSWSITTSSFIVGKCFECLPKNFVHQSTDRFVPKANVIKR